MKKSLFITCSALGIFGVTGCKDRDAEERKIREETAAKARADAARKEMEALPKAFKSPQFFKLNEPEKKPATAPAMEQPKQNP